MMLNAPCHAANVTWRQARLHDTSRFALGTGSWHDFFVSY